MVEYSSQSDFLLTSFGLLIITAIAMTGFSIFAFFQRRIRGALPYAGFAFSVAVYTIFYAFEIASPDIKTALTWSRLQYVGIAFIPTMVLSFTLQFTGLHLRISRWIKAIPWLISFVTVILKFTDVHHHLIYKEVSGSHVANLFILNIVAGSWYYVFVSFMNIVLVICCMLLIRSLKDASPLFRRQVVFMLGGMVFPWLAHILYQTGFSPMGMDITPFGFTISAFIIGYALLASKLFELSPVARDHVFSSLPDAVVVVDDQQVVVDINAAAVELFGSLSSSLLGVKVFSLFSNYPDLFDFLKGKDKDAVLDLKRGRQTRSFLVKRSIFRSINQLPSGVVFTFSDITDRKKSQDALWVTEERYRAVFANSPLGVVHLDAFGNLTECNEKFVEILGSAQKSLIGLNTLELPDKKITEVVSEALEGRVAMYEGDYESVTSKKVTPLRGIFSPLFSPDGYSVNGVVGIIEDLSGRRKVEIDLRSKTMELDSYFSGSLDLLCVLNDRWQFVLVNPLWKEILGYSRNDLEGKSLFDFVHPRELPSVRQEMETLKEQENIGGFTSRFMESSGTYLWLEWRMRLVGSSVYATVRDITSRISEQRSLKQLIAVTEEFLRIPVKNIDYKLIAGYFKDLLGAQLVVFNRFDSQNMLSLEAVAGLSEENQQMLSQEGLDLKWVPFYPDLPEEERLPAMIPFRAKDVLNRIGNDTPKSKKILEHLMGDIAQFIPVYIGDRLAGGFTLFLIPGAKLPDERIVGLFIRQVALLLVRKEAEELVAFEKIYFESLFETAPAGIVILDSDDRIIRCNEEFLRMFGYEMSEVVGEAINDLIVPETLRSEGYGLTRTVADGKQVKHETSRCRKDGSLVNVSVLGKPIHLAYDRSVVYGIYIDITEQVRSRELLHRHQKQIQHALDLQGLVSEAALELSSSRDFELRIASVLESVALQTHLERVFIFENDFVRNQAVCTFEWTARDFAPVKDMMPEIASERMTVWQNLLANYGLFVANDVNLLHTEVREVLESLNAKAVAVYSIVVHGDTKGCICFADCVEPRVWSNPELELMRALSVILGNAFERKLIEQSLLEERDKANLANITKSEFLANMSHEIRTPMNAILGFSEALYESLTEPEYLDMLSSVLSSGRSLMSLLNDILDLSKIEAGKLELSPHFFSFIGLIEEIVMLYRSKAAEKKLRIEFEKPLSFPSEICIDEIRIKQVLFNLLGNAVKFTNSGFIQVFVEFHPETADSGQLVIGVKDTGIGIPEDQLRDIFDSFVQVSGRATRPYEGTGLGLSISKKLVERMNGEILVDSEEGKGSVFRVVINDVAFSSDSSLLGTSQIPLSEVHFDNAEALIIDDVETNVLLLENILSGFGLQIRSANNGETGLKEMEKKLPDLVFLDVRMPGMNGFEVIQKIRNIDAISKVPVLAYTAAIHELKESPLAGLFDGIVLKPINRKELLAELVKFLKHSGEILESENQFIPSSDRIDMESGTPENLPDLIHTLKEVFLPQWETIKDQLVMYKIESFAVQLKETAITYNFAFLEGYASQLLDKVSNFDLDPIQESLQLFPVIIERIEEQANTIS